MSRLRDQSGASLIVAIAFVTLVSAIVIGLLDSGTTSFKSAMGIRDQRIDAYVADGAVEAAIEATRGDADVCSFDNPNDSFVIPVGDSSATVDCEFDGADHGLEIDRTVRFNGSVEGRDYVEAVVIYRDSTAGGSRPQVDIIEWRFIR